MSAHKYPKIANFSIDFNKPTKTINELVQQLQDRGLIVSDRQKAMRYLSHIGYYRLSAYMLPFPE
jgi:abortive infection bacteriophage resistance protein